MKKLLITTMAAVSVGLCAKAADDYDGTKTSFEDYDAGAVLSVKDNWSTSATDGLFVISNLTDFANQTKASRPDYWAKQSGDSKALTIDTDKPLFCDVNTRDTVYTLSDGPIFFDSVVQFTATDVAADHDSADKLRVWLYTSPDDVGTTPGLFKETTSKTCLVVTAGKYDGELSTSNLNAEHYEVQIEGVELQSDTWHRLTIKAIADIDPRAEYATPGFEIWVDGKPVTYGEGEDKKTQFPSLKRGVVNETLQCVAFDGKGAVDDIVFTTTEPEFAKEPEAETANVTITFDNLDAIMDVEQGGIVFTAGDDEHNIYDTATNFVLTVGTTAKLQFMLNEEFELESPDISANGEGVYTITIDSLTAEGAAIAIVTKVVESGDSAWKDNETFATDLTTNVAGLLANVYNKVTGEPTDEQAAYLMTTVGTASGDVTVKVGDEIKAATDKFELSVGNNVKIQVPYYEVTDGVVKVATAIIALETVEITVGDESKTISPAITGVLSVTGITSEENVVGELSNNVATVKVRDTTDPIKLAFDGVVPTDVFFTKKVYTKADASTTVAYGMTGLDDSAFWFYFQYGQNLDDLRSVWNGGSVNYKIGCYNKGIANVVMNITIDQQFTVKFKNGETVVQSTDVWNGEYVTAPSSDPEAPTGQQFVGWFNGDAKFDETVPVTANVNYTAKFEDTATYPSVGGVETPEYSVNAKAAIDAAFPENSYPTGGLTVKVNGETLTGDPAVAMLNEAVEMFILAGDAKFFDEDGVMDISFKATNPLMETETAEATDYEAKVGEATATVTSNYTVNKETVDLTPGVAGENEAVTFKLVIKPAGSTGSDTGSAVQE